VVKRPSCLVELCAGTAAFTLAALGGPGTRPPVSRLGSKSGYVNALAGLSGVYLGHGAERVILAEPDDGCRAMLIAYSQPELLLEVAGVIRGWKDEEPRPLWERLREEGPIKGVPEVWHGGSGSCRVADAGSPQLSRLSAGERLRDLTGLPHPPKDRRTDSRHHGPPRHPLPPPLARTHVYSDCRTLDPAAFDVDWSRAVILHDGPYFGAKSVAAPTEIAPHVLEAVHAALPGADPRVRLDLAEELTGALWVAERVQEAGGEPDPDGGAALPDLAQSGMGLEAPPFEVLRDLCLALTDGGDVQGAELWAARYALSYQHPEGNRRAERRAEVADWERWERKITGYGHPYPRHEQVEVINRWAATGALVMVCESVGLASELDGEWWEVDITHTRKGQKRTFGATREVVTMSRPPVYVQPAPAPPTEQMGLF